MLNMSENPILANLNKEQLEAVTTVDGAVMVIRTGSISIAHPRVPPQGAGAAFPQKIVSCRENIPGNFRP